MILTCPYYDIVAMKYDIMMQHGCCWLTMHILINMHVLLFHYHHV